METQKSTFRVGLNSDMQWIVYNFPLKELGEYDIFKPTPYFMKTYVPFFSQYVMFFPFFVLYCLLLSYAFFSHHRLLLLLLLLLSLLLFFFFSSLCPFLTFFLSFIVSFSVIWFLYTVFLFVLFCFVLFFAFDLFPASPLCSPGMLRCLIPGLLTQEVSFLSQIRV